MSASALRAAAQAKNGVPHAASAEALPPGDTVPRSLRERLTWNPAQGRVCDGPRRYLLTRPDVLMGAVLAMAPPARRSFVSALAASTRDHGADSLRAYEQMVQGDRQALIDATAAAAADLGWGCWSIRFQDGSLQLEVLDSPFAAGWLAASDGRTSDEPVCAPIRGMLQALAEVVLEGPVEVQEANCAAAQVQEQLQIHAQGAHPADLTLTADAVGLQAHGAVCTCCFTARPRSAV